jgi:hypothetical protein
MRKVLRRHLFLSIGVFTFGLFVLVGMLERMGKGEISSALASPMRVLIVPMYLVWLVASLIQTAIAGSVGFPAPFRAIISGIDMIAGFAPYVLADYVLDRFVFRRNLFPTIRDDGFEGGLTRIESEPQLPDSGEDDTARRKS